jgi:NAD(P)-dependent dehydrogenase (short-subunit alcohol dehydrogenase family)
MQGINLFNLSGKVALVTGASKGMGRAMAEALVSNGAKVIISSRKQDQLELVAAEINKEYGKDHVKAISCNMSKEDQIEDLVKRAEKTFGPVNVLVGNAGVNPYYGPISGVSKTAYSKTMDTNVYSNLLLAKKLNPGMRDVGGGSMIFTSSVGAFKPSLNLGVYGMSKLSLIGLTRNLAAEYGPYGIRVNAICPGLIKTDFAKAIWDNPEAEKRAKTEIPLRRLGEVDDFKGIAVFLASDSSSYITGQALTVCGGSNMWT